MGKLLHKLIQGILPPCVFTSFLKPRASSRRLPYAKLRQSIPAPSPESRSSSSSPRSADHAPACLMEIEQSTYYYSYSEDDQEKENRSMAGAGHGETPPVSTGCGNSYDEGSHHYILKESQHGIHNPHLSHLCQCQKHEEIGQNDKPLREGCKRKSSVSDEGDDGIETNDDCGGGDSNKPKRQKRESVGCQLPECISEIVGRGSAIVLYSYQEPHNAFRESMVDMIVSNGLWDSSKQESLLLCYLTLNDPHLSTTICASFLQALKDLHAELIGYP
ncbi:hypothetical protein GOP47_0024157 [Adiantum capillus-veneris]|uniref:Transcription repressor n=1 Tax=Adiantum capillus-veneris TaxID=13818 RepID=A0A9D4U5A9_ADICA|nr:hypothetical protein GOP47_0024157 [Adiantum capillus-veneris]